MLRRVVIPYLPPVVMSLVLGTLVFNELEQHAPAQVREKMHEMRPPFLLGKKSFTALPEFSGDATPQRGVFVGADRSYACVLVLSSSSNNNSTLQERKSLSRAVARAVLEWEDKDVDLAMGLGPRIWDAVRGNVRLGNVATSPSNSNLYTAGGGDVFVHVKADSQTACTEVVEAVLQRCRHEAVAWSEDTYGFAPPSCPSSADSAAKRPKVCPSTLHLSSSENCKVACQPGVGSSFVLFQRWEDKKIPALGKPGVAPPQAATTVPSNHAARVFGLDEDDQPLRILKNTWRTGKLGTKSDDKAGMLFTAYSCNPKIFEYMLERMSGKRGGVEDTTLSSFKLSRSQLFFVPSRAQVRDLAL
ncbi:hypothetical protein BASA81_001252 [Batrachochytrium salamandrivorans]|nr:hypothetical protein BASA81_001252 [Batrachochytrium salamandrivorans]